MKRRSFLAMLGLAPAAAVVGSSSLELDSPAAWASLDAAEAPFKYEGGKLSLANVYTGFSRISSHDGRLVITPGQIVIAA